jgi:hypothetical protein
VSQVQSIKISDADNRSLRHIRVGDRRNDFHQRMNVAQ